MSRSTVWMLVAAVAVSGCLAGCNKFTRERYDTIYVGQPSFEVEKTLGDPAAKFSDTWSYMHESPFYKAVIQFKDGKVTQKVWYDEREMGNHPDSQKPAPDANSPDRAKTKTTTVVE